MSSRAGKMEKQILKDAMPPQKTKDMAIRIDVELWRKPGQSEEFSTYMLITGIPEDLPQEYEGTVIKTAETQFAQAINQRLYLEFYTLGKTSKDEHPMFVNLSKVEALKVKDIQKVN